jgi:dGTPase
MSRSDAEVRLAGRVLSREDIASREQAVLAPYAVRARDSRGRVHDEEQTEYRGEYRGIYQRDRDRIVHCTAFRRLEYKTQVFVNHEGDNYRTRLTHTLEVAQIARGIARSLGLNEDLTEAVALAHDLGHTPFGHSGEDALRELMAEHGGFEHNTHGLRLVEFLERRYPNFPGLNLTYEVRECIAKHATRHDNPPPGEFDPDAQPPLEGQVVNAADEIAYDNHDVEDGLLAGVITAEQLEDLELWREASGRAHDAFRNLDGTVRPSQIVTFLINVLVTDLLENSSRRIREAGVRSADDVRRRPAPLLGFSPEVQARKEELESFLLDNLYQHYRVQRMAHKAKRFVIDIFREYVREPSQLPPPCPARILEEIDDGRTADDALHRVLCDYIAGMTDRYAQDEYKRLFYPFERV